MTDKAREIPQLVADRTNCCGCGVCSFVCPVGAITMTEDEEGFSYPIINEQKCICCYSCIRNCAFSARKEFVRENRKFNL